MPVYTPKEFYIGQPGTTATTLFTVPVSTTYIVKCINICNTTSSAATITVNKVASGGSASAANRMLSSLNINANDTVMIDNISWTMTAGQFISALQGTSSALTIYFSGLEVV
jgi:hypothetical protein